MNTNKLHLIDLGVGKLYVDETLWNICEGVGVNTIKDNEGNITSDTEFILTFNTKLK